MRKPHINYRILALVISAVLTFLLTAIAWSILVGNNVNLIVSAVFGSLLCLVICKAGKEIRNKYENWFDRGW